MYLASSQVRTQHIYSFTVWLASIFSSTPSTEILVSWCHQMLSFAVGSNFHTVQPCQSQQHLILCTPHYLINCMLKKCISAILWQNATIQSSMHQIFIQMCSTVSIGPSFLESPTRFSQAPSPKWRFHKFHYKTFSLPTCFFFIRTIKTIEKQICILPFRKTILDHQTWTVACNSLGHWYTFRLINLKHYIPDIKPL